MFWCMGGAVGGWSQFHFTGDADAYAHLKATALKPKVLVHQHHNEQPLFQHLSLPLLDPGSHHLA